MFCEMQLKDKEQTRKKHAIRPSDSRKKMFLQLIELLTRSP